MALVMLQVSKYYHVLLFPRNLLLIALTIANFQSMSSKYHLFHHNSFRSIGNTCGTGSQARLSSQQIIVEVPDGKSNRWRPIFQRSDGAYEPDNTNCKRRISNDK